MKYKLIAIIGSAGSGKDSILQKVAELNPWVHEIVSCTTRPPRDGEVDGVNYHLLTNEQFACKVLDNQMLEATVFNDWCYGTSFDSLYMTAINIGVFNPAGIESILAYKDKFDLTVYYVRASDKTRLIRQLNREEDPDIDEIFRRFKTDREDFFDLDFDYIELINEEPDDVKKCAWTILNNLNTRTCI